MAPGFSWAALEREVVELADQANEVKTVIREAKGAWLPVPIPVSNPTVGTGQLGLGDVVQSLFFAPKLPTHVVGYGVPDLYSCCPRQRMIYSERINGGSGPS